jgi:hypothetical protein
LAGIDVGVLAFQQEKRSRQPGAVSIKRAFDNSHVSLEMLDAGELKTWHYGRYRR